MIVDRILARFGSMPASLLLEYSGRGVRNGEACISFRMFWLDADGKKLGLATEIEF